MEILKFKNFSVNEADSWTTFGTTDKYEEIEHILFADDETLKEHGLLSDHIKVLILLVGAIDGDIADHFEFDDTFFEAIENEYKFANATFTREEVKEHVLKLVEEGYVEAKY